MTETHEDRIIAKVNPSCSASVELVDISVVAVDTLKVGVLFRGFTFSGICPICLDNSCQSSSQPNSTIMFWIFVGFLCFFVLVFLALGAYWLKKRHFARNAAYVSLENQSNPNSNNNSVHKQPQHESSYQQ